jgi:Immunity protein 10
MMVFDVLKVTSGNEEAVFVLAFAVGGKGDALVFQLADSFDEQDALLGMDTYSISTAMGATVYGGIGSASLEGLLLVLRFQKEAAATLGLPDELGLKLPDAASLGMATDGLRHLGVGVRRA